MPKMGPLTLCSIVLMMASVQCRQQWEEEPGYKEVNPDGDVVMVCRVKNKKGECRWERDNTPIAAYPGKYEWAGDTDQGDCSLRILAANYQYDNGAWVCQVTASSFKERDTLISHPANLVVRAPPSSVHLRVPGESSALAGALVATSGSEVDIECVSAGGNPAPGLQWYLGGQRWEGSTEEINQETGITVSMVKIPVTKRDHMKQVRCEVIHEALTHQLEAESSLNVQYLPQVSVDYDSDDGLADIAEGDQVTVSCSAIGNPLPDIMWYRDISGEIVSRHNTLTITDIRRDQAGAYVCQANNSVGQSNPRKIDIQVKYAPVITSVGPSSNVTQLLRSKLELTCQASGNPLPVYTWVHHTETGTSEVRGHEKNLIITGIMYSDQGQYECQASNIIKGERHVIKSTLVSVNVTGAPKVAEKRSEVFIVQGTDASVTVEFCADPMPELNWHLGGDTTGHSVRLCSGCVHDKFTVLKEEPSVHRDCYVSTLMIANADKTDSRDYQLHLENGHGLEIHTVRVNVGEMLSQETLIGAVCGGGFVLILILISVFSCARRCCPNKQLKQDIESSSSGSHTTGWTSQDDVSIQTDPHSEMSSASTNLPDIRNIAEKYYPHNHFTPDNYSFHQECLKPVGYVSPTPSSLTERPGSNASGPSRVSYNDLCFPKTANYGSMRKSGRCDIEARLSEPLPPSVIVMPATIQQSTIHHLH